MKYVAPSVRETAFNCPHCGALAKQYWFGVRADNKDHEHPLPIVVAKDDNRDFRDIPDKDTRAKMVGWLEKLKTGRPYFEGGKDGRYSFQHMHNVNVSQCYNCDDLAIWIYDRLVY